MVVTVDVGVVGQLTGQQGLDRRVGGAGRAAVQPDAGSREGGLRAAADAAADQNVGMQLLQDACQSAVALAVGADHFAVGDLAVCHVIDLELFGAAEMLENFAVCVGDCDSHGDNFLSAAALQGRSVFPLL